MIFMRMRSRSTKTAGPDVCSAPAGRTPRSRRRRAVWLVALSGSFLCGPAIRAQSATAAADVPESATATRSEGLPDYPANSRNFIKGFLNLAQFYDGNVYGRPGQPSGDTFTDFGPRISWERFARTTQWTFNYGAEMRRYARFSNLNTMTQDGTLTFQYQNSAHFKWGLSQRFLIIPDAALLPVRSLSRTDDRLGPAAAGPAAGPAADSADDARLRHDEIPVITGRGRRLYERSALSGQYTFNPRAILNLEGAFEQMRFSRPDLTPYNNVALTASFAHQQTARRTMILAYQLSHYNFNSRLRSLDDHQLMAGVSAKLTRTINADAQVGPSIMTNGVRRLVAWDARLGLEKSFARTRWRAGYARFLGSSGGLTGATRNQSFLVAMAADLSRRTILQVSAAYSDYHTVFSRDLNLHGLFWSAALDSRINKYMGWFLSYQRINQSRYASLGSATDYNRLAVGLRVLAPLYHQ